jgi:hypothetical protein
VNIQKNILSTLAYFNLFDYPLKKEEVVAFLAQKCDPYGFERAMQQLLEENIVFRVGHFLSLRNDPCLAERRKKGNQKAGEMMRNALASAKIISLFPFVRGVAVSGSLSKNFAGEGADVDLFIITSTDRLWISRTILHLFKKLTFLSGRQHLYCMNYFVDESQLNILEKNIYTAIETVTLLPLYGNFEEFYKENTWTKKFLPNVGNHAENPAPILKSIPVKIFERILNNKIGGKIDTYLMKTTASRWRKKTECQKTNSKGNILAMHCGKHFSKPWPGNFQNNLLLRYEKDLREIFAAHDHLLLKEMI